MFHTSPLHSRTLSTLGCPSNQANHAKQQELQVTQFHRRHGVIKCLREDFLSVFLGSIYFVMLFENSFSEFVDRKFSQENNFWQGLSLLRSLGEDVLSVFWGNTFFDVVWKLLLKFCWQFLARIVTTEKMQICNLLIKGQSPVDAKSWKNGIFCAIVPLPT